MAIGELITLHYLALATAIILVVVAFFKGYPGRKARNRGLIIAVILGVIFLSGYLQVIPALTKPFSVLFAVAPEVVSEGEEEIGDEALFCAIEDTTVTLSSVNKYTTVTQSSDYHRYAINGAPALVVADAGTFTASPGDSLTLLFGNTSRSSNFGEVLTKTLECKGTKTLSGKVVNNGTITMSVFNEGGDLMSATVNETLGTGDLTTLDAEVKGEYQKDFPSGLVLVIEYNKTAYDDIIVEDISGFKLTEVSTPRSYTPVYQASVSTTKSFDFPPIISTTKWQGTITFDVDDTYNPGGTTGDIRYAFYAKNYFINDDMGGIIDGPAVEDEKDAVTRGAINNTLGIE